MKGPGGHGSFSFEVGPLQDFDVNEGLKRAQRDTQN